MNARAVEVASLAVMALAVLVGGPAFLAQLARFHDVTVLLLGMLALAIIAAFRLNFRRGGHLARVHAARDAAFLAAIAGAIAFVMVPARWSLGSAVVATEIGLVVELMTRFV